VKQYSIILKNEKKRTYRIFGWIFFPFQLVVLAALFIYFKESVRAAGLAGVIALLILFLILDVLFVIAVSIKKVQVSETCITYPAFPVKSFNWKELNQVILKDGLLTIDLRNNKLIQQLVDENLTRVDEREFNDFCSEQLKTFQ